MMSNDEERRLIDHWSGLPEKVAVNANDIAAVKEDIHGIREDIKSFRREAREDAKSTRQAVLAFASAISVPIILAALKLLLG